MIEIKVPQILCRYCGKLNPYDTATCIWCRRSLRHSGRLQKEAERLDITTERVLDLFNQGMLGTEIGVMLGCSYKTVYRRLRRAGISGNLKSRRMKLRNPEGRRRHDLV